jgi:hypothetical protein
LWDGIWDEAFEVRTIVVVLYRAGGDTPDFAGSLNTLSICLSGLGRREGALKANEEAGFITC